MSYDGLYHVLASRLSFLFVRFYAILYNHAFANNEARGL
jgi:hypothetical protein